MITDDMERLGVLKSQLRAEKRKYAANVKPIRDEIRLLEASITEEVLRTAKTITFGGVKAEYKPTVVILVKKENSND